VRGATGSGREHQAEQGVSIHAPGEGSDSKPLIAWRAASSVSIHAPGEGSDLVTDGVSLTTVTFQSTLPVRGATPA